MHCKGSENIVADILSRYPGDSQEDMPMDCDEELEISAMDIKLNKSLKNQLWNIAQYQQSDYKPVSYTHLDVYKRQGINR